MKRSNMPIGAVGITAMFVFLYACQKGLSGVSAAKASITASSTNVAVGQVVNLAVVNAPWGTHNVWSGTGGRAALFNLANVQGAANVSFSKPGTYVITVWFESGAGADSLAGFDSTQVPHDSVIYYPPPPDSTGYHGDTTGYHGDTTGYHGDTTGYHGDTTGYHWDTTGYHVDTTGYHGDTTGYHGDTTHYYGDTTHHGGDSTINHNTRPVIGSASIVITVH